MPSVSPLLLLLLYFWVVQPRAHDLSSYVCLFCLLNFFCVLVFRCVAFSKGCGYVVLWRRLHLDYSFLSVWVGRGKPCITMADCVNSSSPLISQGIWEIGVNRSEFGQLRTHWNSARFCMALLRNSVGIPGGFRGNVWVFWENLGAVWVSTGLRNLPSIATLNVHWGFRKHNVIHFTNPQVLGSMLPAEGLGRER